MKSLKFARSIGQKEDDIEIRPMIASDIGGMAEKITDGKDGLHFKVRNPRSLAEKLTQAISDIKLYDTRNFSAKLKAQSAKQQCKT